MADGFSGVVWKLIFALHCYATNYISAINYDLWCLPLEFCSIMLSSVSSLSAVDCRTCNISIQQSIS